MIERGIRTVTSERTPHLRVVPYRLAALGQELALYCSGYNILRPHTWLGGATPDEIYHPQRLACRAPRFEPRPRWPRRSHRAALQSPIHGQPGAKPLRALPPVGELIRSVRQRSHLHGFGEHPLHRLPGSADSLL